MFVATVEFISGAEAQAKSLGYDPAGVFTEHPIQDRSDSEMHEISDSVFDQIVAALTQ